MRVLFVSSGRSGRISPLIENQANSLASEGVKIDFFLVESGIRGYFLSISNLRKKLTNSKYNIVHAHYSFSAFVATLAGAKPLVVSLLGSDAYKGLVLSLITRYLSKDIWAATIVKTLDMQQRLGLSNAHIIPNGVNIERFKPIPKSDARTFIRYNTESKLAVFVADPNRHEKNYMLAVESIKKANERNNCSIVLMPVYNTPNEQIPYYMNAADLFLLTSKREGGVNVVKEAMACNIPIVSTDVGDVRENIEGVAGCFVCEQNVASISDAIIDALKVEKSDGRDRLLELGLDSKTVAQRIIKIYEEAKQ